jgi:SSS family solute:Na+ symporter
MAYVNIGAAGKGPFTSSTYPLNLNGLTVPGYAAFYSLLLNLGITIVLSVVFNLIPGTRGADETAASDYTADKVVEFAVAD